MKTRDSVTAQLIKYIRNKPVLEHDLEVAGRLALGAVACMIAGGNSETGRKLRTWATALADPNSKRLVAGQDPVRRAFLNGALCQVMELDDVHQASLTHPGCVVVPALLALGHGLPIRDVLTALLHGYEACARIGMAVGAAHYRFWHNTSTCGPFGAAMAAGHLLNLDAKQAMYALGNAGTQSSGFKQFLETGDETKYLHAGRGAEAGLVGATLAALDFTGPPEILEGRRALFAAICPDGDLSVIMSDKDAPWQIHATSQRPWPCSRHTHPAISAVIQIREEMTAKGVDPNSFSLIEVEVNQTAADLCNRADTPTNLAAQHSLQHCAVAALSLPRLDISAFGEMPRASLAGKRQRVRVSAGLDLSMQKPGDWGARVNVYHPQGAKFSAESQGAKGDPKLPMSNCELAARNEELLSHGNYSGPDLNVTFLENYASDEPFELPLF